MKKNKTNAMRLLDKAKIKYKTVTYDYDENNLSGVYIAQKLNEDENRIFKTLVLSDLKKNYIVCVIPVNRELNLKKVAKAAGLKKVEMIPMKDLLKVTGYIRGGCTPIGMKKEFPTFVDNSILEFDNIGISGGKRGLQIFLDPKELIDFTRAKITELI